MITPRTQNQITRSHKRERHRGMMFFNEVRRCAYILGAWLRALLPINSSTTAATPLLHGSTLIFMGPRDTKYDSNSISNLPKLQLNSSRNWTVHIFDTYPTNFTLAKQIPNKKQTTKRPDLLLEPKLLLILNQKLYKGPAILLKRKNKKCIHSFKNTITPQSQEIEQNWN